MGVVTETQIGTIHREGSWAQDYMSRLGTMGWNFQEVKGSKLVAAQDKQAEKLIEEWRQTKAPVEISIVAVMPNGTLGKLPARALGYAGSALSYAESLQKMGVNVGALRIVSPCKLGEFVNGGDSLTQEYNAEKFHELVTAYRDGYQPGLRHMAVTLDTGKPILDETVITQLAKKAEQIAQKHPVLAAEMVRVSAKYNKNGIMSHAISNNLLPLVYLLAHPEAWGYAEEELLFAQNWRL